MSTAPSPTPRPAPASERQPNRGRPAAESSWWYRKFPHWFESVPIPRWVVYAQATLLGLVGTVFFVFGMAVGHFTTPAAAGVNPVFDCRVTGSVAYREAGNLRADDGAVVFLLPQQRKPDRRSPADLVNPDTFQALDNVAIDRIHELGGAVVRADENGYFDVLVDANSGPGIGYDLLIVSRHLRGVETDQMTKAQSAAIGTFFVPVEDVVEDRSYHWSSLKAYEEELHLPEIELGSN